MRFEIDASRKESLVNGWDEIGLTLRHKDEIKAYVAGYAEKGVISKWAVPRRVLVVDMIDKTSVGKLDKKLLRQKYAQ